MDKPDEASQTRIVGLLVIKDKDTNEVLVEQKIGNITENKYDIERNTEN